MNKKNLQQGTGEWHQWRKGKITGTTLKDIMGTPKKREDAFYEILAERLTIGVPEEGDYENAMDRGLRLEPDAVSAFELETGLKVERVGGVENDTNPMMANSPDGLIGETEAVEIKCLAAKNHLRALLKNEIPDDYKWQIVQYFIVNEKLQKLYFAVYHPDIPNYELHIIVKTRDEAMSDIQLAKVAQEKFLAEVEVKLTELVKEL